MNINDLAKELLRTQENYKVIDKENDRLKEIEQASHAIMDYWISFEQTGRWNHELWIARLSRLRGALNRNEQAKKQRRKR